MDELIGMVKEYGRLCAEGLPESAERELEAIKAMLDSMLDEPKITDGICPTCGQMDAGTL